MIEHLLILGASARAAAFSAARGGWRPWCGDLFGDVDLARRFSVTRAGEYPDGLATLADAAPPGPWLYTGALENYPALIDRIAARRRLYGNSGSVLRKARDPSRMAAVLSAAGLAALPVAATSAGLPVDGSWLRKGLHSGGGSKVQAWRGNGDAEDSRGGAPRFYYQQRASGLDCSAVFLAAAGQAMLLGVTRQLIATDWLRAKPFHYAGSLGPLTLDPPVENQWRNIGAALAAAFGLSGLFGVDAVLRDGIVWPVELNPRYPASAEVLERAMNFSAVGLHVEACQTGRLPPAPFSPLPPVSGMALATGGSALHPGMPPTASAVPLTKTSAVPLTKLASEGRWYGKAILFAHRDVIVSDALVDTALAENDGAAWPLTADIPAPRSRIHAGAPVMTLFADGRDPDPLCDRLRSIAARYEGYLLPA